MFTLSLDSQVSEASLIRLRNEVEEALGREDDPLVILIKCEEEFNGNPTPIQAGHIVKKETS